jgi:sugar O-acyltransferase (sialic acid O-acetyltransferase NeuD family)
MKDVVIFGNRQIAELAHFYLTKDACRKVVAFTADQEYIEEHQFCGLPVVPFEEIESTKFGPDNCSMLVAISYTKLNKIREQKYLAAKSVGYSFVSFVHSKASTDGAIIGENCFVLENVVVQPFTKLGNNVTVWSGTHIGHHSEIGDNCFITSQVVISGGVKVGKNCFMGVNSTIRDHITIGENCIIGAGCLIMKDITEDGLYSCVATERSAVSSQKVRL